VCTAVKKQRNRSFHVVTKQFYFRWELCGIDRNIEGLRCLFMTTILGRTGGTGQLNFVDKALLCILMTLNEGF
jgi:hypothetical protein